MTNQEFAELLQDACNGDDEELFQICHEHQKFKIMLAAAHQVLAKFPEGHATYRGFLLHLFESSSDTMRPMVQEILNEIEFGFPETF